MKRVCILLSGKVVGVGFRLSTIYMARDLGLKGWVRNAENEYVEIIAEGPKEKLEKLINWVRKGPPTAKIREVKIDWREATGEFERFEVRR